MKIPMNKAILIGMFLLIPGLFYAQKVVLKPTSVTQSFYHDKSKPLRDVDPKSPSDIKNTWPGGIVQNNFERRKHVKSNSSKSAQTDRVLQTKNGTRQMSQNIDVNFDGMGRNDAGGATPPDPSGAVGPEHYFQMLNLAFEIYDKSGASVYGPSANNSIFDGWDDGQPWNNTNDGDPIVLYDNQADRWMVSHFSLPLWSGPYFILIAYSETNDPLGAYYRYAFQFNNMPDYPKFGIWPDGLYMTANSNSNNAAVFQRDSMLVGGNASMISFSIPDYPGGGFRSALAADCDGDFPAYGTPNYIIYYNDDTWGSYPNDHLRIWEFQADWNTTANSTLSLQNTLITEAFDSNFGSGWSNISQPNGQKIDAIAQAMMFRSQYREFPGHASMVCNYVVDVDGNDHAGIRWYELRKDTASTAGWYIYQQGTYAPDSDNRWLGSASMDKHGNIALAYSVSSPTTYPSLRFTGHTVGAPLGVMNIAETEIVAGSGSQSGNNRYGDYSHISIDPVDDETFWFTSEYIPSNGVWKTRIASFHFDPLELVPIDAGILSYQGPLSGPNLGNQEAISVKVANFGTDTLWNIPIDLYVNSTLASSDTIGGMLLPADHITYTFSNLADMSAFGQYNLMMILNYAGDTINYNDSLLVSVESLEPTYCEAGGGTGYEFIYQVKVDNYTNTSGGSQSYSDFTTDTISLILGSNHAMEVALSNGYATDKVIAWFDWNQDLDFDDSNEKLVLGTGVGPVSATISVPANAMLGNSRMRVRLYDQQNGPNGTPCGDSDYGEVEDYTILVKNSLSTEIINPDELAFTCSPNPVKKQAIISFTGIDQDMIVQLINENGKEIYQQQVKANSTQNNILVDMQNEAPGLYFVRLRLSNYTIVDVKKLIKIE